jgi:hypothetical protein
MSLLAALALADEGAATGAARCGGRKPSDLRPTPGNNKLDVVEEDGLGNASSSFVASSLSFR